MKQNEFFDVNRRHEFDPQRLRRIVESWSMDPVDLSGECFSWHGVLRDDAGAWHMPNGLLVGFRPFCGEAGWCRWQLPGADGATRGRLVDRHAPWVARSPAGVFFLCTASAMRRVSFLGLLDEIAGRAELLRVPSRNCMARFTGGAAA